MHMRLSIFMGLSLALAGLAPLPPAAEEAATEVLLTVAPAPGEDAIPFDRAALDALPQQEVRTSTIWTVGTRSFSGPSLRSVLDAAGITGGTVRLEAINDYSVTLDVAELEENVPIVASRIEGKPYTARQKGPLWIVYPYDAGAEYRTETVYARSVWQLVRITAAGP